MDKSKPKTPLLRRLAQRELEEIGGEPLEGSGFEEEEPEPQVNERAEKPV